jgi:hypothetical protein
METNLTLLTQKECITYGEEFFPVYDTESMICAYGGQSDACSVRFDIDLRIFKFLKDSF